LSMLASTPWLQFNRKRRYREEASALDPLENTIRKIAVMSGRLPNAAVAPRRSDYGRSRFDRDQ
jgi:hypothetical protein